MENVKKLGRVLSRKEMSMISGGLAGKVAGVWKGYSINEYQECQNLLFTMQNTQYVLNPDGTDPLMELWKKLDCDNNLLQP